MLTCMHTHIHPHIHTHVIFGLRKEVCPFTVPITQEEVKAGQEVSKLIGESIDHYTQSAGKQQHPIYSACDPHTVHVTPIQCTSPTHNNSKDDSGNKCSYEPLPCLVGGQLDKARTAKEKT